MMCMTRNPIIDVTTHKKTIAIATGSTLLDAARDLETSAEYRHYTLYPLTRNYSGLGREKSRTYLASEQTLVGQPPRYLFR